MIRASRKTITVLATLLVTGCTSPPPDKTVKAYEGQLASSERPATIRLICTRPVERVVIEGVGEYSCASSSHGQIIKHLVKPGTHKVIYTYVSRATGQSSAICVVDLKAGHTYTPAIDIHYEGGLLRGDWESEPSLLDTTTKEKTKCTWLYQLRSGRPTIKDPEQLLGKPKNKYVCHGAKNIVKAWVYDKSTSRHILKLINDGIIFTTKGSDVSSGKPGDNIYLLFNDELNIPMWAVDERIFKKYEPCEPYAEDK